MPTRRSASSTTAACWSPKVDLGGVADPDGVTRLRQRPTIWETAAILNGLGDHRRRLQSLILEVGEEGRQLGLDVGRGDQNLVDGRSAFRQFAHHHCVAAEKFDCVIGLVHPLPERAIGNGDLFRVTGQSKIYGGSKQLRLRIESRYTVGADTPACLAFAPEALLRDVPITIALGSDPLALISDAARQFQTWTGCALVVVDAPHEVYLMDPAVLSAVLVSAEAL